MSIVLFLKLWLSQIHWIPSYTVHPIKIPVVHNRHCLVPIPDINILFIFLMYKALIYVHGNIKECISYLSIHWAMRMLINF